MPPWRRAGRRCGTGRGGPNLLVARPRAAARARARRPADGRRAARRRLGDRPRAAAALPTADVARVIGGARTATGCALAVHTPDLRPDSGTSAVPRSGPCVAHDAEPPGPRGASPRGDGHARAARGTRRPTRSCRSVAAAYAAPSQTWARADAPVPGGPVETHMIVRLVIGLAAHRGGAGRRRAGGVLPLPPGRRRPARARPARTDAPKRLLSQVTEVFGQTRMLKWTSPGSPTSSSSGASSSSAFTLVEAFGDLFDPEFHLPLIGRARCWASSRTCSAC